MNILIIGKTSNLAKHIYYKYSPTFAGIIDDNIILKRLIKFILNPFIYLLKKKEC